MAGAALALIPGTQKLAPGPGHGCRGVVEGVTNLVPQCGGIQGDRDGT
jgi:hypothetical protein